LDKGGMMELLYLASPYSHVNPIVRQQRFEAVCRVAGRLMHEGKCVFSPIAHSHPIEQHFEDGSIEGHDFWLKQDFAVLSRCSRLVVVTLDGWEASRGVAAEIQYAHERGIPLEFMAP
jgi:hypothetical protein